MIRVADPGWKPGTFEIGGVELDPPAAAKLKAALERAARNLGWFNARVAELWERYPGQYIAVYDGRVYAGDRPDEVAAQVRADHPDDWGGSFRAYIPPVPRG